MCFCSSSLYSSENPDSLINFQSLKFKYILEQAYQYHNDSLDIVNASDAAFAALLSSIDKQSAYYSSEKMKSVSASLKGREAGFGFKSVFIGDTLIINSVYDKSPADSCGIKPGDAVLYINGFEAVPKNIKKINDVLSAPEGSSIKLIVRKFESRSLIELNSHTSIIDLPSIWTFPINDSKTLYIKISSFSDKAYFEFIESITPFYKKNQNIIVDLRACSGGNVEQCTKIIDEFIEDGYMITKTRARNSEYKFEYPSTKGGKLLNNSVIVIIDAETASAGEIFASAMQDLDRGYLIGLPTFGKGTVQKFWNFNDSSAFRLTIAEYVTLSGRIIEKPKGALNIDKDNLKLNAGDSSASNIIAMLEQTGGRTSLPIYKSKSGRPIIGGGSIYPDFRFESDTLTLLTKVMLQNNLFFEYAIRLKHEIEKNFSKCEDFCKNYSVNDQILQDFIRFSKNRNIWNESMFIRDRLIIENKIKESLAGIIWGDFGKYYSSVFYDECVKIALDKQTEAASFLKK